MLPAAIKCMTPTVSDMTGFIMAPAHGAVSPPMFLPWSLYIFYSQINFNGKMLPSLPRGLIWLYIESLTKSTSRCYNDTTSHVKTQLSCKVYDSCKACLFFYLFEKVIFTNVFISIFRHISNYFISWHFWHLFQGIVLEKNLKVSELVDKLAIRII